MRAAAGLRHAPPLSDAQILAQLRNPNGTLRTEEEVIAALYSAGWGANHIRIRPLLQEAAALQQPAATGSQAGEE
jgi:hypothetical protein